MAKAQPFRAVLGCGLAAVIMGIGQSAEAQTLNGRFVDVKLVPGTGLNLLGTFEGAPSISADQLELFFHSNREGGLGNFDVYRATRTGPDRPFEDVENLGSEVNSAGTERAQDISPFDDRTLFFYRDGDIFQAIRSGVGQPFGSVTSLGEPVNSGQDDRSANISSNGQTLYFASTRAGGFGGQDLYQATLADDGETFEDVQNLGPVVNTSDNENNASISANGLALFFTSRNRPGSVGPSDIWVATRQSTTDEFLNVVNLNDLGLGSAVNGSGFLSGVDISNDWPAFGSKLYFNEIFSSTSADIFEATWVPEPSTAGLCVFGLLCICGIARRSGGLSRF